MKTILIAGASGLVGKPLVKSLRKEGYRVRILTRNPKLADHFYWNPEKLEMDESALESVDSIINLAGAGIADERWTSKRKEIITSSRVNGALTIRNYLKNSSHKPSVYISAGAIGYYGNCDDQWRGEDDNSGNDFLSKSCVEWEKAVSQIAALDIRTVQFRIGIVLSKDGGAWPKLFAPFKFLRIAPVFGNGQMWYSWIHLDDLVAMINFALEKKEISGIFNAVSPHPVTQKEMMKSLISMSGGFGVAIPIPSSILKIGMGEMSAVVLSGSRVSSDKIQKLGFKFNYPTIESAIKKLI